MALDTRDDVKTDATQTETGQSEETQADEKQVRFDELGLSEASLQAVENMGFDEPSPIQARFVPVALKGTDCIGQARTGTGKTAAFTLPVLDQLDPDVKGVQALVLAPTRELSEQVAREFERLSGNRRYRAALVVGGRRMQQQIDALKKGAEVVIGTPGRIIDLMRRKHLDLSGAKFVVLDEADRMLDIGFRPDIERILRKCPKERQTLLLSATMPPPVQRLAQRYMQDPEQVDLSEDNPAVDTIDQYYCTVDRDRKMTLLAKLLLQERPRQALVFVRTKRGAEALHKRFQRFLKDAQLIHGDLPQRKRDKVMKQFRNGETRLLFATDVVGRGIDISGISHIINYDIPEYHDDYVHRVGRTGRMSSDETGIAITFVTREQGDQLTAVEMRINKMLQEYEVDGFEPARPVEGAKHVEPKSEPAEDSSEEWGWDLDESELSIAS